MRSRAPKPVPAVLTKENAETIYWRPLEEGRITALDKRAARAIVSDGERRIYFTGDFVAGRPVRFRARGSAGEHWVGIFDESGGRIGSMSFVLKARTEMSCDRGPYTDIANRIEQLLRKNAENRSLLINGRLYRMFVTWGRDHVHTLKAMKYLADDVKSGLEYWLESQEPNGMFWDCIHPNPDYPAPTWFGEALGKGWYRYDDGMKYIVRRIPVEADCEFLYTEGVWYAWKASGDDAWMAAQLPRLEKALKYNNSHRDRWSRKHGLVRRSMCMDSWDFVNPLFCNGDHRCINPGDPQFLFHSDNSGLYASYWRMAEMYEHLGGEANQRRAAQLRKEGEALRQRANKKLFFGNCYGHMIPETLPEKEVYARVGDERKRMSLSTGYTINRRMPTHAMAVKILKEYQRRGKARRGESFAEWWTMDPPYLSHQWPRGGGKGFPIGEYMNGAICTIIAGELAKAAFDHGMEAYGADILERVWKLSQRDGGELHQVYRRLPENPRLPKARFRALDLRAVVNRGLRNGAHPEVVAWTGEGDNDMRNLPVGRRKFGAIEFDVIDPKTNGGRAVLRLDGRGKEGPRSVTIPVDGVKAQSLFFMHATPRSIPHHDVAGVYDVSYADGSVERIHLRTGYEIGHWWGVTDTPDRRRGEDKVNRDVTRVAWRGANGLWKNVGLYMHGWNNPHPDSAIVAIRAEAYPAGARGGGLMLAAISASDQPVAFEPRIRSYGLPDCWSQAAVYYAVAEGLAGIEDLERGFSRVRIAPRWAASCCDDSLCDPPERA